jgi:hypothetical protein
MSMGLFLMESLRITRLFPVIAALPDRTRIIMVGVSLGLLTILASVEAGLAYMREVLLQDELATASALRGAAALSLTNDALWITTAAQMGMGFILPFALTFVAIPLETFVQTLRHVLGLLALGVLKLLALGLRVTGNLLRQSGMLLLHLYDLLIFAPLWIEERLLVRRQRRMATDALTQAEPQPAPSIDRERQPLALSTGHRGFDYGETPA